MRTTVDIGDDTLTELRELAAISGRPFKEVLDEVLQRGLAGKSRKRKRVRIFPRPAGIKPAYRGMSMNQLYDQLEADGTKS